MYCLFSVLVGLAIYAGKKAKNAQEFSSAGRRIGMFVAMCTIVASEWGGGNVMGTASDAYSYGISAYIFPVSMGIGIFCWACCLPKVLEHRRGFDVSLYKGKVFHTL